LQYRLEAIIVLACEEVFSMSLLTENRADWDLKNPIVGVLKKVEILEKIVLNSNILGLPKSQMTFLPKSEMHLSGCLPPRSALSLSRTEVLGSSLFAFLK